MRRGEIAESAPKSNDSVMAQQRQPHTMQGVTVERGGLRALMGRWSQCDETRHLASGGPGHPMCDLLKLILLLRCMCMVCQDPKDGGLYLYRVKPDKLIRADMS